MSVPSHNLYDFVHQVTEKSYWLMYFKEWGNRNLNNCYHYQVDTEQINNNTNGLNKASIVAKNLFPNELLTHQTIKNFQPVLLCHDQEPLNYDLYLDQQPCTDGMNAHEDVVPSNLNLRACLLWSWQQKWILLHSELNSSELERYEMTGRYVGAYWWSHAILARDWYRYAEYDPVLKSANSVKTFLIYCREDTGSREYRQDFLKLIAPIKDSCQIGSFHQQPVTADASAIYDANDFTQTDISIVLETVFDQRIHLTEKILRAIACGHPFILAAGPGSLQLLKKYGFATFDSVWNESYDQELDSNSRLQSIVDTMNEIASWDEETKQTKMLEAQAIAEYNKQVFFSSAFYNRVIAELKLNVDQAGAQCNQLSGDFYWQVRQWRRKNRPEWFETEHSQQLRPYIVPLIRHFRQGKLLEQYQRHDNCLSNKADSNSNNI